MKKRFAAAINCMDGRIQIPVIEYMRSNHMIDCLDIITEAGPIRILSEGTDKTTIENIKKRLEISVVKHGSKIVAISGHHDCAGNPEKKETQLKQILSAIKVMKMWELDVLIIGLWIDENWNVWEIKDLINITGP